MISTGPGNSLEARDSQIQGTQQQNAPMYLSTNPHGRNSVASLPLECSHLTPKSFKVLSAFPSYLQTPDLSLSTQFGMAPVHGSHWILGIFNSEIEMSLERKQVCHAMPHALLQRVVAQYLHAQFPNPKPGQRVWQKHGHRNLTAIQSIWSHEGSWHSGVSDAVRIISAHFRSSFQRQRNPCTSALS